MWARLAGLRECAEYAEYACQFGGKRRSALKKREKGISHRDYKSKSKVGKSFFESSQLWYVS